MSHKTSSLAFDEMARQNPEEPKCSLDFEPELNLIVKSSCLATYSSFLQAKTAEKDDVVAVRGKITVSF